VKPSSQPPIGVVSGSGDDYLTGVAPLPVLLCEKMGGKIPAHKIISKSPLPENLAHFCCQVTPPGYASRITSLVNPNATLPIPIGVMFVH